MIASVQAHLPGAHAAISSERVVPFLYCATYAKAPQHIGGAGTQPATCFIFALQEKSKAQATDWKEHTAPDGRKYYYNKCGMRSTPLPLPCCALQPAVTWLQPPC